MIMIAADTVCPGRIASFPTIADHHRSCDSLPSLAASLSNGRETNGAASQSLRDFSMAHRCDTLALDSPIALDVGYPYPAVNESCSPRLPVQCTLCSSSSRDSKQQTVLLASLAPCSPSRASLTTATFAAIIATATVMGSDDSAPLVLRMKKLQIRSLMLYFHVMLFMCLTSGLRSLRPK